MPENFTNFLAAHSWIFIILILWTLPWKGVALWKAARNRQIIWFVALLVLNTLAILEIIYIFRFSKKKPPAREFGGRRVNGNGVEKVILDIKNRS